MTEKEKTTFAVTALEKEYPDAKCSLNADTPFRLLIATRLSAQCTDARVNIVTPKLFSVFPDAESMANADITEIEELIKPCGLYKTKAKDLIGIAKGITENFGRTVPDSIEKLTTLPGVGRKTANLICGDVYGQFAVVTDTHFIRIMNKLGFVKTTEPKAVETKMRKLLSGLDANGFCHRTVLHGRKVCTARSPKCEICCLRDFCKNKQK